MSDAKRARAIFVRTARSRARSVRGGAWRRRAPPPAGPLPRRGSDAAWTAALNVSAPHTTVVAGEHATTSLALYQWVQGKHGSRHFCSSGRNVSKRNVNGDSNRRRSQDARKETACRRRGAHRWRKQVRRKLAARQRHPCYEENPRYPLENSDCRRAPMDGRQPGIRDPAALARGPGCF
jgi:hypothetical protein